MSIHSNDFIWYSSADGPWVQKPTGFGARLIIINAITKSGWVPSAKLVFKSTRKTGDYHGQMNWNLFSKWFSEMLLPNIPESSLIIRPITYRITIFYQNTHRQQHHVQKTKFADGSINRISSTKKIF